MASSKNVKKRHFCKIRRNQNKCRNLRWLDDFTQFWQNNRFLNNKSRVTRARAVFHHAILAFTEFDRWQFLLWFTKRITQKSYFNQNWRKSTLWSPSQRKKSKFCRILRNGMFVHLIQQCCVSKVFKSLPRQKKKKTEQHLIVCIVY